MYREQEATIQEVLLETLLDNVRQGVKKHKVLKSKVSKVVAGKMSSRIFFTQVGFSFIKRFIIDSLISLSICSILSISNWYIVIFVAVRVLLMCTVLLRMFMDEL